MDDREGPRVEHFSVCNSHCFEPAYAPKSDVLQYNSTQRIKWSQVGMHVQIYGNYLYYVVQ
jgi:hypothetical protein